EVRLAVDLDEHAHAMVAVDVRRDRALRRHAPFFLGRGGEALLLQPVGRLAHVALGLHQGLLAVGHAGAGALAQLLHHGGGDVSHDLLLSLSQGYVVSSGSADASGWATRRPRGATSTRGPSPPEATWMTCSLTVSSSRRSTPRSRASFWPRRAASAILAANSLIARMASSLPGMT